MRVSKSTYKVKSIWNAVGRTNMIIRGLRWIRTGWNLIRDFGNDRRARTIKTRQFCREPDFVVRVLLLVAIDSIEGDRRRDVGRRTWDSRSNDRVGAGVRLERRQHLVNRAGWYLRRLTAHEQSTKHAPGARAERRRLCLRGHGQPALVDLYQCELVSHQFQERTQRIPRATQPIRQ